MKHPLIIGAGGVASYLLPVLLKTFRPAKLTIIDKDILEERNLDRQMFNKADIGKNKARALADLHFKDADIIEQWFTESTVVPDDIDAIICCADNHLARHEAIKLARKLVIYAYIGGNEYLDSQALVYHPDWADTDRDLLKHYPTIATSHEGSPMNCQGEAQEATPQLAVANLNCAAKLLHLMWVYDAWLEENLSKVSHKDGQAMIKNLPYELFTSLTDNTSAR